MAWRRAATASPLEHAPRRTPPTPAWVIFYFYSISYVLQATLYTYTPCFKRSPTGFGLYWHDLPMLYALDLNASGFARPPLVHASCFLWFMPCTPYRYSVLASRLSHPRRYASYSRACILHFTRWAFTLSSVACDFILCTTCCILCTSYSAFAR